MLPQTNVQLLTELAHTGWSAADLQRMEAAYWFVVPLLGSRIRPDGRPFLSHLCGTAGLAARAGAGPDTTIAALLHAVFAQGRMAEAGGASAANQAKVASVAGERPVQIILAYDKLKWVETEISMLAQSPPTLTDSLREVLLIRLANEADDAADGAAAFSSRPLYAGRSDLLEAIDRIAAAVAAPSLAVALREGLAQADRLDLPESTLRNRSISFSLDSVPPRPLWRRASGRARRLLGG